MFLHHLPQELVKPYFDLCYTMASADGTIAEQEMSKLKLYAVELNLKEVPQCDTVDYADTLDKFAQLSDVVKKKIFFELLAMANSDFTVTKEENELINIAREKFGIDKAFQEKLDEVVIELKRGYFNLAQLLKED